MKNTAELNRFGFRVQPPFITREEYKFPVDILQDTERIEQDFNGNKPASGKQYIILVSCGSFNPITNLHLRMFENAKDYLERECGYKVIAGYVSPVHDRYAKESLKVSGQHRYVMCSLATRTSSWIATDAWEILQDSYSRTRAVLNHFKEEIDSHYQQKKQISPRILLLCGADLLESFVRQGVWRPEDVSYILETFGTACVERDTGASVPNLIFHHDILYKNRKNIHSVPAYVTNNVSSTRIRTLMGRGYSVKYYLDDLVIDYIKEYGIFNYLNQDGCC
jgi:nicotinamide mononucleotide adenylyltransferase